METFLSIFVFGKYTVYIWSAVCVTLFVLVSFFWKSQRQLVNQKKRLQHIQRRDES